MESTQTKGRFKAIESYIIRRKNEVYVLGELLDGHVQAGWYAVVPLNDSLGLSVKIAGISTVKIAGYSQPYTLLILKDDDTDQAWADLVFAQNIGNEILRISDEAPI